MRVVAGGPVSSRSKLCEFCRETSPDAVGMPRPGGVGSRAMAIGRRQFLGWGAAAAARRRRGPRSGQAATPAAAAHRIPERASSGGPPRPRTRSRARRRRRQGPVDLGHVLQASRARLEGSDRRRRLRSLPPLQGGRRADEGARPQGLPPQRLLAARAARGDRRGQRQGAGLLRPPDRRAAGGRHHAVGDAVPLGSAARALPPRRLAEPRHRRLVRRLRDARRQAARRSRPPLDARSTSRRCSSARGSSRGATRPATSCASRSSCSPRTTRCSRTAAPCRRCARRQAAAIGTAQAGYNYVPATDSADDLAPRGARYLATADDSSSRTPSGWTR